MYTLRHYIAMAAAVKGKPEIIRLAADRGVCYWREASNGYTPMNMLNIYMRRTRSYDVSTQAQIIKARNELLRTIHESNVVDGGNSGDGGTVAVRHVSQDDKKDPPANGK